ncbi:MAG: 3-oxoadipyl-CoA thiolase [Gemmatimonadaceae bacterium]
MTETTTDAALEAWPPGGEALARRVIAAMLEKDALSRWLGLQVVEITPGGCVCRMTVRAEMVNGFGVAHGGIVFSLADSAFAFACNQHGQVTVAVDNTITYPAPIHPGDELGRRHRRGSVSPPRLLSRRRHQPGRDARGPVPGHRISDLAPGPSTRIPHMSDAFLVDGVRTPVGAFAGSLSDVRADDLAATVIRHLLARYPGVDPSRVTDVILGCANQAGDDNRNVARMALLLAGMPVTVPGETVNRLCASGLSAIASAARGVRAGEGDLYVAGGVESMTRAPYVMSKGSTPFARDAQLFDTSIGWRFVNAKMRELYGVDSMGQTAENVAEQFGVSREDQDRFALASQQKAAAAREAGRLAMETVPVAVPGPKKGTTRDFADDEFIKPDTTLEALAKLRPAFRTDGKGSVTAGNSSGINDGACAVLVASERAVSEFGLKPKARIVAAAAAGVEPRIMGMGPVPTSREALRRAGLQLSDMAVIELNEAFAAQGLACLRELGLADDDPRVNPNGGAIAIGHPLGMSGARLALTAAYELQRTGGRYALCTMCIGVGQGMAMVLERA